MTAATRAGSWGIATRERQIAVAIAFAIWLSPAVLSLASQTWRTEAGSIAPLLLALGGFALWDCLRRNNELVRPSVSVAPLLAMVGLVPVYMLASAIDMVALLALVAWVGGVCLFVQINGWRASRRCAFPLLFLGLAVPLPYTLSLPASAALRDWTAQTAAGLGHLAGMNVAVDRNFLFVGPYALNVETACAGLNSTVSLVAIGLLFAFWIKDTARGGYLWAVLLAIPFALLANVLRILALMGGVSFAGAGFLETALHPLSGVLSFGFALTLFYLAFGLGGVWRRIGSR